MSRRESERERKGEEERETVEGGREKEGEEGFFPFLIKYIILILSLKNLNI